MKAHRPKFGTAAIAVLFFCGAVYVNKTKPMSATAPGQQAVASPWGLLDLLLFLVAAVALIGFSVDAIQAHKKGRASKAPKRLRRNPKGTCRPGDTEWTSGVIHEWVRIDGGEDRRVDGRIRWWSTLKCSRCKTSKLTTTDWDQV